MGTAENNFYETNQRRYNSVCYSVHADGKCEKKSSKNIDPGSFIVFFDKYSIEAGFYYGGFPGKRCK